MPFQYKGRVINYSRNTKLVHKSSTVMHFNLAFVNSLTGCCCYGEVIVISIFFRLVYNKLNNVYRDGVVREVNAWVLGKGLELLSANGGRIEINQLLFVDDTAQVANSEKLCRLVSEYGRVCEISKLRVNVGKSKVMRCSKYGNGGRMHVILNGKPLEAVDCFKYLGSQVADDGGCERDMVHRMNEGYRAWGVLKNVMSNRGLGIKAKKCLYEGVITQTALYGAEAWGMRSENRRKVNVLEMKCLRSLVGVSRMDRVRNEEVCR